VRIGKLRSRIGAGAGGKRRGQGAERPPGVARGPRIGLRRRAGPGWPGFFRGDGSTQFAFILATAELRQMTPAVPSGPAPRVGHATRSADDNTPQGYRLRATIALARNGTCTTRPSTAIGRRGPRGSGPAGPAGVIWRSFAVASMKANWDAPLPRTRPAGRPLLGARSGAAARRSSGPAHRLPEAGRAGPAGVHPRRWLIPQFAFMLATAKLRQMTPAVPSGPAPRVGHATRSADDNTPQGYRLRATIALARNGTCTTRPSTAIGRRGPRGSGPAGPAGVIWRSEAVASMKAHRDAPSPRMRPAGRPLPASHSPTRRPRALAPRRPLAPASPPPPTLNPACAPTTHGRSHTSPGPPGSRCPSCP
jgi:hypothetical protein